MYHRAISVDASGDAEGQNRFLACSNMVREALSDVMALIGAICCGEKFEVSIIMSSWLLC